MYDTVCLTIFALYASLFYERTNETEIEPVGMLEEGEQSSFRWLFPRGVEGSGAKKKHFIRFNPVVFIPRVVPPMLFALCHKSQSTLTSDGRHIRLGIKQSFMSLRRY